MKLEDITHYDMFKFLKYLPSQEQILDFIDEHVEEIYSVKPYKKVPETLNLLSLTYEPVIITAAPDKAKDVILFWMAKYEINCSIIFDRDKIKYNGLAIIDDCPKYLENNSTKFSIKMNRPYNTEAKSHKSINEFLELPKILKELTEEGK